MTPTPEQLYEWAAKAGVSQLTHKDALQRFAALACAWQAEQDANRCDAMKIGSPGHTAKHPVNLYRCDLADAIRVSVKGSS